MRKSFVITLAVLTLLASPIMTNAGFFGSSFDGCKDPGDDIAGYILEKSGDSTLTRSSVEQALKFVPTDVKNVTYGDIFGWLRVTENTAECFAQNDYKRGLEIIGTHAGKFTASKALGVAVVQLVGGAGGAVVFLPATIFQWGVDYLINRMEIGAVNHQLVLYIAAIESCEESYGTRAECQQMIIDESKYGITSNFPTAFLSPNGFILEAVVPKNPKFTNIAAVNSIKSGIELYLSGQIKITAQEFYTGAAVVYDALAAKYSGSLNAARNAALQGVVIAAKRVTDKNSNTETQNNQKVGFFANLWGKIVNLFVKNDTNTELPAQKDQTTIQPSDLSGQISNSIPANTDKKEAGGQISNAVDNVISGNNLQEEQPTQKQLPATEKENKPTEQINQPKPQTTQQPSPTTTQVKTINLRCKTGCDKNWGSPIPFVSLDWDVSYENMTSQTIYRNNEVILNAPPSVGHSYFDGIIKAGRTYNYVIKVEYKDGYSNSAEANVVVPIDVCGPINPVQNETPASQPPSTSPAPSVVPPASSSGGGGSGSIPQTNTPPTKKTIIATIVDQNDAPFDYLIFACEKPDGSNCSIQTYSSGMMALGPYPSGEYRITVQAGARGGEKSDAVVRSVWVDETASGTSIDLGTIVLKRWGRIFVSPIDEAGNPLKAYWELEGVFDNDLCSISPISLIGGLNRDYYCSNGKTFYNYSLSNRVPSLDLEKYSFPDGQYVLRAFDSLYSSTGLLYKTTVRILQGQDVNLGRIEIK